MSLTYDKAGRKLTMDDPDMGFWQYDYDALGNLKTQTDARGCVTNIAYDELNRPTGKTYSNCPSTPNVTYTYDQGANGKGRRTSMGVSGVDFTQWTYDSRGRVLSEAKQITGGQFVTEFTYNLADSPKTMTYPGTDAEVVNFEYNNNMLPVSVNGTGVYAQSVDYDSANRITQIIRGANKIEHLSPLEPTGRTFAEPHLHVGFNGNPAPEFHLRLRLGRQHQHHHRFPRGSANPNLHLR